MKLEWKELIRKNIPARMLAVNPTDIKQYCNGWETMSAKERTEFYVDLFTELCRFESGFNPKCTYKEGFNDAKGKPVISTGLFQVSVESLGGYGFKVTQEQLFDPETNIKAMLTIASRWIIQDEYIATPGKPWLGLSRYWSPFRTPIRKRAIQKVTLSKNYGGGNQVSIYDQFYAAAKSQMGIAEMPGKVHSKAILGYHAETTLKAVDDETPWCSSFANWVTVHCGVTGTRSASAKSWMKWGKELKSPVNGCIVVFTRTGGGHVAFYDSEDKDYIYTLGGNQGDRVCIAAYPKSRLLGYRGVA
jgi:uncharacterized protein (TIGR02594 family)